MFPQLVANKTASKGQAFWKFFKAFYNTPHLYKGIQRTFEQPKCLQFTNCLRVSSTISAVSEQGCTTNTGNNLRIIHGYFCRWIRHLMTCSQKKFALLLYLSKGIFKGYFASFARDFNIWRYHLLPPLRKNFSLYLPIWKGNFAYKIGITPTHIKVTLKAFWWGDIANIPHLIATRMAFWGGTFSKIQSIFTNIPLN